MVDGAGGLRTTVSIHGWWSGVCRQCAGEGRIFPGLPASPWQCAVPQELMSLECTVNPLGWKRDRPGQVKQGGGGGQAAELGVQAPRLPKPCLPARLVLLHPMQVVSVALPGLAGCSQ